MLTWDTVRCTHTSGRVQYVTENTTYARLCGEVLDTQYPGVETPSPLHGLQNHSEDVTFRYQCALAPVHHFSRCTCS